MKRKFENRRRSYEASMNDDLHPSSSSAAAAWKMESSAAKSSARPSRVQRRVTLSPELQKPQLRQLPVTRTRPVSPDQTSSVDDVNPLYFQPIEPEVTTTTSSQKNVRFSNDLQVREIARITHSSKQEVDDSTVSKSILFYSKHDYMKFYVRERSRLAFQDLTKRICREQERRIRNRQRVIPPYFVALNFWNAVMTINELGHQVKQQQLGQGNQFQQQQQYAMYRQQKRRRRHLFQTLQQQSGGPVVAHPLPNITTPSTRTSRTTSNTIPNHYAPANLRHAGISMNSVKPRAPRRNTVIAAVA